MLRLSYKISARHASGGLSGRKDSQNSCRDRKQSNWTWSRRSRCPRLDPCSFHWIRGQAPRISWRFRMNTYFLIFCVFNQIARWSFVWPDLLEVRCNYWIVDELSAFFQSIVFFLHMVVTHFRGHVVVAFEWSNDVWADSWSINAKAIHPNDISNFETLFDIIKGPERTGGIKKPLHHFLIMRPPHCRNNLSTSKVMIAHSYRNGLEKPN